MWIELPKEVKNRLIEVFQIPLTGITEIIDQRVVCDGHTGQDLMAITHDKMNAYIGSQETFLRAWELTLAKVKYELAPPPIEIGIPVKEANEIPLETVISEKPFCDFCDSKGVRHKKGCPKDLTHAVQS